VAQGERRQLILSDDFPFMLSSSKHAEPFSVRIGVSESVILRCSKGYLGELDETPRPNPRASALPFCSDPNL